MDYMEERNLNLRDIDHLKRVDGDIYEYRGVPIDMTNCGRTHLQIFRHISDKLVEYIFSECIEVDADIKASIIKLINDMDGQDNRGTASPYYYNIMDTERIYGIDGDYDHDGMIYVDKNDSEIFYTEEEVQENEWEEEYVDEHFNMVHYKDMKVYKNAFLSEKSALEHVRLNHYHYNEPKVYAEYAFRNKDIELILEFLNKVKNGRPNEALKLQPIDKAIPVISILDLKKGDTILIVGKSYNDEVMEVEQIKSTSYDGIEVILNSKSNLYFNLNMYLDGKSWVNQCYRLESPGMNRIEGLDNVYDLSTIETGRYWYLTTRVDRLNKKELDEYKLLMDKKYHNRCVNHNCHGYSAIHPSETVCKICGEDLHKANQSSLDLINDQL